MTNVFLNYDPSSLPISPNSSSILFNCSSSCVDMKDVLSIAIPGGTPGDINALVNTPASNSFLQNIKVLSSSPIITGTIAVCPSIISKPIFLKPSRILSAFFFKLSTRHGSFSSRSSAAIAAATEGGVGEALNINAGRMVLNEINNSFGCSHESAQ